MRAWLIRAPWWVQSLLTGSLFGLFSVLSHRLLQDRGWGEALIIGTLSGVVFGALMGPVMARMNRRYRQAAGEENLDRMAAVGRRGWRGKVGGDPELRAAARRVTLLQRDQLLRQRRWAVPFFVLMVALGVWLSLTRSSWYWATAAVPAAILIGHLVMPARLERRAEDLRDAADGGH